jgi:glycosyltransferase involved in cell wall biosynthesis
MNNSGKTMNTARLITVAMPVYNCQDTIAESIASILNQTIPDWELIVLDDGSKDHTVSVARRFTDPRIRVIEGGRNRRLAACLNAISSDSRSEYFARIDGDDIAYPERFEKQLKAFAQDPALDLLGGSSIIFDGHGVAHGLRRAFRTHAQICGRPWSVSNLAHVTWFGRTAWFKQNPYDERCVCAQDRDLLTRARRHSRFAALPDVVMGIRESVPQWRKLWPSRKQMLRTALREGIRQLDPSLLFITSGAELLKLGIDFVATSTGLNHRLLKYRVPPVPAELVAEWNDVFEETRARVAQEIGVCGTL